MYNHNILSTFSFLILIIVVNSCHHCIWLGLYEYFFFIYEHTHICIYIHIIYNLCVYVHAQSWGGKSTIFPAGVDVRRGFSSSKETAPHSRRLSVAVSGVVGDPR